MEAMYHVLARGDASICKGSEGGWLARRRVNDDDLVVKAVRSRQRRGFLFRRRVFFLLPRRPAGATSRVLRRYKPTHARAA